MPVKHRTSRPRTPKAATSAPVAVPEPVQTPVASAADPVSEHEEVARIAYSYWEARGRQHGFAEEDWLRAEQEYRRLQAL